MVSEDWRWDSPSGLRRNSDLPLLDTMHGSKLREVEGTRKEVIQIDASSSSRGYLLGEVALT